MASITIKRGDTLLVKGVYKQDSGIVMDLTGYTVEVNMIDDTTSRSAVTIVSGNSTSNRSVVITNATAGEFVLVMKDTEVLKSDDYWIDFKAVGISGYEQTSQAVRLKVKNKLV